MASNGQIVIQMDTSGIEGAIAALEQSIASLQSAINNGFSLMQTSVSAFVSTYNSSFKEVETSSTSTIDKMLGLVDGGKQVWQTLSQMGDSATTLAGKCGDMNAFLQLVKESGGGLSGFTTALGALNGPLGTFGQAFSTAGGGLSGLKAGIMGVIEPLGGFGALFSTIGSSLSGVASAIAGFLGPVGIVIAVIGALVAAFIYFWNTSEEFRDFWIGLWETIVSFVSPIIDAICLFFTETIPNAWNTLVEFISNLAVIIPEIVNGIWNAIVTFFTETIPSWIDSVIAFFGKIPYYLGYMVGLIIGCFLKFGEVLLNFILVDIPNFINGIIHWFASLPEKIWQFLTNIITKIIEWGANLYENAKQWVESTITSICTFFGELPEKIKNKLIEVVNRVKEWGTNLMTEGAVAAKKLFDSVVQEVLSLPQKMLDLGKNLVEGLWNGIKGAKDWLFKKIDEFCDGILDGIRDFFKIFSPSHVMRDEIGKFLPAGIAIGFEMAVPSASKNMQKASDDLTNDLEQRMATNMDGLMGVTLQNNADLSKNTSLLNAFPKTMKVLNDGKQAIVVKLGDATELAHALVEPMSEELAYLR